MTFTRRPPLALDGRWNLELVDVPGVHPATAEVDVPGSWTLQVPGCELAHGTVRYSRTFEVPADWPQDGSLVLRFGAVNHGATVRLDGVEQGRHEGGWTPFEVPLDRSLLTGGPQRLEVDVSYPALLPDDPQAVSLQEVPHGKQTWYGTNAGIWQPVTLEHRPRQYVRDTHVRTEAASGGVTAVVHLAEQVSAGTVVAMRVRERADGAVDGAGAPGAVVAEARSLRLDVAGDNVVELSATVPDPRLWSPLAPHRYDVEIELQGEHEVLDAVTITTGLRSVTTKDGSVLLNGEPIELRGVLDQDIHPGSTQRSENGEELEELFSAAKRLGFNLLRCHIKRPDPIYFEIADRMGMLVWAELPSWQRFTPRSAQAAQSLLEQMIRIDGHHPSIVAWTVVNESWGVDVRDQGQRSWMRATQQRAKELAPETLVVDNSACESNFHVRTDLDDFHVYRGIPERRASWDEWVDDYVSRPEWTFSPYGDAERTGEEPLVVSEFGNWGLPDIAELAGPDGLDPWWAAPGRDWAFGAAEATDTVGRFYKHRLDEVFGSWQGFVEATQRQQLLGTRYQIGSLRRRPQIAGYVLTQLSDVQWEANGLFDMDRRPRMFVDDLALVNGPSCVVLRAQSYAGFPGDVVTLTVDVVPEHGAEGPAEVVLTVAGQAVERRQVDLGSRSTLTAEVVLPAEVSMAEVRAELHSGGRLLSRDVADVAVLPPVTPRERAVQTGEAVLAAWLTGLGVPVTACAGTGTLLVTRCFDEPAQAHARRGGRVLVVAEDASALGGAFAAPLLARLSPREGDGDWVPRFDWIRRRGPLAALPGGPLLDLAYEQVIGDLVIDFLPAPLRPAHLHSAVFAGWLQHRASTTITVPWSGGAVTITTFRLRTAGRDDAAAAALTRALLDVAEQ